MAHSLASRRRQRGAALLALVAVAVLVFGYVLTSRLNAASQFVAVSRDHNAKALAQAKQALIGWMALNAAGTDANPGRLPCPEAVNAIGTDAEGIAAPLVSPSTPNCATLGRLPWRTLGLEKLVDAASEPLWYAVSPGWALQNSSTQLTINADSLGAMAIDGQAAPNEVVAVVIAPGPAMSVQAAAGCTARTQARAAPAPSMDPLDYVECFNIGTPAFATTGPAASFNDQVVRVTAGDLLPALEAAIANRIQREVAPAIKAAAYTSTQYPGSIPAGALLYPYPVAWTDPTASAYLGGGSYPDPSNPQGLLPFNQIGSSCTSPPPCTTLPISHTTTVRSTLSGSVGSISCSTSATEVVCEGRYYEAANPSENVRPEMAVTFSNVAMGFRALDANPASHMLVEARNDTSTGPWTSVTPSASLIRMNNGTSTLPDGTTPPKGSVSILFRGTLPNIDVMGWGDDADFRMRLNRAVFSDHTLLSKTHATHGWFVRNQWYRNTYYAVAQANTADSLSSLGCSAASGNCLRYIDSGTYNIRALLILAGRSLPTQSRQTGTQRDDWMNYVEGQNGDSGTRYEQRIARMSRTAITTPFEAPWNDRVILVDWDSASPPNASQVVSLSPLRVVVLP